MIRLRKFLKWTLFAVVLVFVGRHGYRLWTQSDVQRISLTASGLAWLALSAVVYSVSWLPSVWFWRALMRTLGASVTFRDAARAYFCGHLGKYIPGKAMVLVIRGGMMQDRGCPARVAALTAAFETLTMMGTGLAVGAALAPGREWVSFQLQAIFAIVALAAGAAALPYIAKLLSWIAIKTTPGGNLGPSKNVSIPARLVGLGCAAFVLSWAVQGISLGLTLRAVDAAALNLMHWSTWMGAMALSTSVGFAVLFAPAGLGVREGVLLSILTSQLAASGQIALAAVLLSRVVSFSSEIAISTIFWTAVRVRPLKESEISANLPPSARPPAGR